MEPTLPVWKLASGWTLPEGDYSRAPLSGYDLAHTPPKRENWFRNHRRRLAKDQKQRKAIQASIEASEPYQEE